MSLFGAPGSKNAPALTRTRERAGVLLSFYYFFHIIETATPDVHTKPREAKRAQSTSSTPPFFVSVKEVA